MSVLSPLRQPTRAGLRTAARVLAAGAVIGSTLAIAVPSAGAATTSIVVNSLDHVADDNAGDGICDTGNLVGSDPECTLMAALEEANAMPASPGDDISITFDASLNGEIDPSGALLMSTGQIGQGGADFLGLGAYFNVDAAMPVTIDFGGTVGIVANDLAYSGILVSSNNVTIQGFTNMVAGEAGIVTGATDVTIYDGVCSDPGTNDLETCIGLIDGATDIVIDEIDLESVFRFGVYFDDGPTTVNNIAISNFRSAVNQSSADIFIDNGLSNDYAVVNGLSITNSTFSDGVGTGRDAAIQFDAYIEAYDVMIDGVTFENGNSHAVWAGGSVDTTRTTIQNSTFDGTHYAWGDNSNSTHTALTIKDNTFEDNLQHVLDFVNATYEDAVIEGNSFSDARGNALATVWVGQTGSNNEIRDNDFVQSPSADQNRWAIYSQASTTAGNQTGWSFLRNHIEGYFGSSDAPITILGGGITPAIGNTFGTDTRGSDDVETETGISWFVANRNAATNGRIQTWRVTNAQFSPTDVTVSVAPVTPEASNNPPTNPVHVDVYWTATDRAEVLLGRIWNVSSATTQTFASTAGSGSVRVQTVDAAGRTSQYSSTRAVQADTVAPTPPTISTAPKSGALTGTGEANATVTVRDQNGTVVCSTTVDGSGAWSCAPSAALSCGTTLSATQTDSAGNVSAASVDTTIDGCPVTTLPPVDSTAPSAPVVASLTSARQVSGTGEPGATVTVRDQNGSTVCLAAVGANGTWTCAPVAALACGSTLTATQTDAAGNASTVSAGSVLGGTACADAAATPTTAPRSAGYGSPSGSLAYTGSSSTTSMMPLAFGLLAAGALVLVAKRARRLAV